MGEKALRAEDSLCLEKEAEARERISSPENGRHVSSDLRQRPAEVTGCPREN